MSPARTLQTADPCARRPGPPSLPPAAAFSAGGGQGGEGAETLGCRGARIPVHLPKKTGWAGGVLWEPPGTGALLPCPSSADTLSPRGVGREAQGSLPVETARRRPRCPWPPGERVRGRGRGGPSPGRGPGNISPRLFIPYSVAFLFYFTLITIIQEYYLLDKFRVSFLIYNFLLC